MCRAMPKPPVLLKSPIRKAPRSNIEALIIACSIGAETHATGYHRRERAHNDSGDNDAGRRIATCRTRIVLMNGEDNVHTRSTNNVRWITTVPQTPLQG
jgi:hypothetical protein